MSEQQPKPKSPVFQEFLLALATMNFVISSAMAGAAVASGVKAGDAVFASFVNMCIYVYISKRSADAAKITDVKKK